ncbi:MAG: hypothetical protein ACJAUR_002336 [Ulvibacter sp.]
MKNATLLKSALSNLLKLKQETLITEYLNITDSISRVKLLQVNKYAGIRFDFLKEQKRVTQIELLKSKEKRKKLIAQVIGVFLLLASIFISFYEVDTERIKLNRYIRLRRGFQKRYMMK